MQTILEAWPPMQINSVNKKKESPLHIAVFRENIQWAKRILEMGCDVNLQVIAINYSPYNLIIPHQSGYSTELIKNLND